MFGFKVICWALLFIFKLILGLFNLSDSVTEKGERLKICLGNLKPKLALDGKTNYN
jgi:hypothetical protein